MDFSQAQPIVLSQELIDMIIDQLGGSYDSLKRGSLVSRRWQHRCQQELFRVVVFSDSPPGESIERWCTTFNPSDGVHLSWILCRVGR